MATEQTSEPTVIQWGNFPAWVAAIGTSASLLAGMYIILRDRMIQYRVLVDQLFIAVPEQWHADTETPIC